MNFRFSIHKTQQIRNVWVGSGLEGALRVLRLSNERMSDHPLAPQEHLDTIEEYVISANKFIYPNIDCMQGV